MALHSRNSVTVSAGRCAMTPLRSFVACSLAEGLHAFQEVTLKHAHRRAKQRCKAWCFGTWNVRLLVDNESTVETARLSSEKSGSEDRRIDLVIRELTSRSLLSKRPSGLGATCMYHVGKSIVLTAGLETPKEHQSRQREGETRSLSGIR